MKRATRATVRMPATKPTRAKAAPALRRGGGECGDVMCDERSVRAPRSPRCRSDRSGRSELCAELAQVVVEVLVHQHAPLLRRHAPEEAVRVRRAGRVAA